MLKDCYLIEKALTWKEDSGIPQESGISLQFHVIKYINKELKENIAGIPP